ncbi:hypothetical protein ALC57_01255, partial [Trachymyrmex cornetzi]
NIRKTALSNAPNATLPRRRMKKRTIREFYGTIFIHAITPRLSAVTVFISSSERALTGLRYSSERALTSLRYSSERALSQRASVPRRRRRRPSIAETHVATVATRSTAKDAADDKDTWPPKEDQTHQPEVEPAAIWIRTSTPDTAKEYKYTLIPNIHAPQGAIKYSS